MSEQSLALVQTKPRPQSEDAVPVERGLVALVQQTQIDEVEAIRDQAEAFSELGALVAGASPARRAS